jgi:hypothetical protein
MGLEAQHIEGLPAVEAAFNYLVPMAERPRNYAYEPPAGVPRTNTQSESHRLPVNNIRVTAKKFTLDDDGFALLHHQSEVLAFDDEDEIRRIYYPESERLLKAVTGADRVFIFDHTLRRHIPGTGDRRDGPRQPVLRVHVDHTAKSGPQRVRDLLPDEAEELLRGRVQVINLWRPIRGPVFDSPLAVCDAHSVRPEDLVGTDLVYQHRVGETYSVTFNPAHRWFYAPAMRDDEALLIKCFDSERDGRARFAPHSAFIDPTAPSDAPSRQSIEIRSLVFHTA